MAPIRVGFIGLSTSSDFTNWAAIAHYPYLRQSSKYEIVALCNSSVEKAKASIKQYGLPESTKAYGSPEDLAKDSDVDLVVCVVGVEHHYEVLLPLVEAGKNVYTELPIAVNIDKTRKLAKLAEQKQIRTVMGMQGQASPVLNTIKKTIEDGKLGKILSSTITGYAGPFGGKPMPTPFDRMLHLDGGENMVTVWFLHTINNVLHVLGELNSFHSMLGISHPKVDVFDLKATEKKVEKTEDVTAPDQVFFQGETQSGVLLNYHMEGGKPFPGEPGLRWHIVGDKGELMITNPSFIVDVSHEGVKILLHEHGEQELVHPLLPSNPVAPIELELPKDDLHDMSHPAQNVGRLYEAYADGATDMYADWKLGLRRHELIEEMFQRWGGKQPHGAKAEYLERSL